MEKGIIVSVGPKSVIVEDDYKQLVHVYPFYVEGKARVGATCTLVTRRSEGRDTLRAFVEPRDLGFNETRP
jgi:hypothetical protein